MKMNFTIDEPNLIENKSNIIEKNKRVLWKFMVKMEELAKLKAPVDKGILKSRIHLNPLQYGAKKYTLSDGVMYGLDLEMGNRPHHVNMTPLIEWVKRKGIATNEGEQIAFAKYVQEKIAREGVNAQPFFRPAADEAIKIWLPKIKNKVFGQP